jgi:hypothetical protein
VASVGSNAFDTAKLAPPLAHCFPIPIKTIQSHQCLAAEAYVDAFQMTPI